MLVQVDRRVAAGPEQAAEVVGQEQERAGLSGAQDQEVAGSDSGQRYG